MHRTAAQKNPHWVVSIKLIHFETDKKKILFLIFPCCEMAILMTSIWEIRAIRRRKRKTTKLNTLRSLNVERCEEEKNMKGNWEHPLPNCYSTQDVRLQLSLGAGNRQSWKSSKCRVDKGWEVFKVIGKGSSHPPRSSLMWLIVSVSSKCFTFFGDFCYVWTSFLIDYFVVCFKGLN